MPMTSVAVNRAHTMAITASFTASKISRPCGVTAAPLNLALNPLKLNRVGRRVQPGDEAPTPKSQKKKGGTLRPRPPYRSYVRNQPVKGRIRISTRRFCALPSGVAFVATGLRELLPAT